MPVDSLRIRARVLMWLVTVPFAVLALIAVMQMGYMWRIGRISSMIVVMYLPMYVYIWAIWMVRQALRSIARGELFDRVVPKLLFRVGIALFVAALFNVFGVPILGAALFGKHAPTLTFDGAAVTLGVVGATLVLVSQLLSQAVAMREELDEFV
ncbi:hypothetical protein BH09PSE4_BH09PSE4_10300 [soil metagenome]